MQLPQGIYQTTGRVPAPPPRQLGPVIRLAQKSDKTRWRLVEGLPDHILAQAGWQLGGPIVHLDSLDAEEQNETRVLLYRPSSDLTVEQRLRLSSLLSRCDRSTVPPIDLDLRDSLPPHQRNEEHRETLGAITRECISVGLPAPVWTLSGGKGFHGDLHLPEGVQSPHLLEAVGDLVREAARRAGVPLLSEHREKGSRPPVVVDDSLYTRAAGSRGVVWRLIGAEHPSGERKRPIRVPYPAISNPDRIRIAIKEVCDLIAISTPDPVSLSPAERAEVEASDHLRAEVATWPRIESCPLCRKPRCRQSPDGTLVYCFRRGGVSSPGELVDVVDYHASKSSEPEEQTPDAYYVRMREVSKPSVKVSDVALRAAHRHASCGLAWSQNECRNPAHAGQRPVLGRYPLRCGMPHVCLDCAQSASTPLRLEARTAVLRDHVADGRGEIAVVRLYPERPRGPWGEDEAIYRWIQASIEMLNEIGRRRRGMGEGCAILGAEYAPDGDGDPLPYRPVIIAVVRSEYAWAIYKDQEILTTAETMTPLTAALLIQETLETLPFLSRDGCQKVAAIDALHSRRRIRHYGGLPAVESATREALSELCGVASPEEQYVPSCPLCKEPSNGPHATHLIILPSGRERPYQPGGLRNPIVLETVRRDYLSSRPPI